MGSKKFQNKQRQKFCWKDSRMQKLRFYIYIYIYKLKILERLYKSLRLEIWVKISQFATFQKFIF